MFMPTSDYTQQLFAYLQAWRQLLEQWTGMTAAPPFPTAPFAMPMVPFMPPGGQFMPPAVPFMPPGVPFMPPPPAAPVAPAPPAPADYAQQLFSYLAAWRQYLEQAAGAAPVSPPAPTPQPTAESADGGGTAQNVRPPDVPIPPADDTGSKGGPTNTARKETNPTWPPPLLDIRPGSEIGSQVISIDLPGAAGPFERGPETPQVLSPPEYDFGYRFDAPRRTTTVGPAAASIVPVHMTPEAPTHLPITGTPFRSAIERAQATLGGPSEVRETPAP